MASTALKTIGVLGSSTTALMGIGLIALLGFGAYKLWTWKDEFAMLRGFLANAKLPISGPAGPPAKNPYAQGQAMAKQFGSLFNTVKATSKTVQGVAQDVQFVSSKITKIVQGVF